MSQTAARRAQEIGDQAEAHFNDPAKAGKLFVPTFARNALEDSNVGFEHDSFDEAWPEIDPGMVPLGEKVLVQFRQPRLRSAAGLELSPYERKAELDNTQVAKVIAIGPLAFRKRDTAQLWPEGAWCAVGDFVRVPKFQGDYFQITYRRIDCWYDEAAGRRREEPVLDRALFANFKDIALLGRHTPEQALKARAYL